MERFPYIFPLQMEIKTFNRSLLKEIIADQAQHRHIQSYVSRTIIEDIKPFQRTKEIIIITGIRRCGKSTVLQQIRNNSDKADYYFNFE